MSRPVGQQRATVGHRPEGWLDDYSNRVPACRAWDSLDNRYEPSFKVSRPTNLDEFYDLRDKVFVDRQARMLKCHEQERAFFAKHWQSRDPTKKPGY